MYFARSSRSAMACIGLNRRLSAVYRLVAMALCGLLASSCGGGAGARAPHTAARSQAPGPRVCGRAAAAARARLRVPVRSRVADGDPTYLECLLDADGIHLDVVAQAIPQAVGAYDTTLVHQVQFFDGAGNVRDTSQLPQPVARIGTKAAWVAGQDRLLATNGTRTRGGNFLSVTVAGRSTSGPGALALARAVAIAVLAVAPRGPNVQSEF
jgi:hypothetical protein